MALLEAATFEEIRGVIAFLVEKENDERLLDAYRASFAALQNISFDDFRRRVREAVKTNAAPPPVKDIHHKVQRYIDTFQWEEA